MKLLYFKIVALLAIFVVALVAGWIPFKKRLRNGKSYEFPLGEALAAGVFLGASLMHMLGDANQLFSELDYKYPWAYLLAGVMFLLLLFLEHLGHEIHEDHYDTEITFAFLAMIMLCIHAFLEGTALGISDHLVIFIMILVAILTHKWAAGFALAIQLNKGLHFKQGLIFYLIFAVMTPLGILFGSSLVGPLQKIPSIEPIFLALAAGTFLYLGTLHGLKRAVLLTYCCDMRNFLWMICGFSLMAMVAIWA